MSVLYIALPMALLLGGGGMLACILSIRRGQYDDLDTPAVRMLIDDKPSDETRSRDTRNQAPPTEAPSGRSGHQK
ncbi:cbb3-type cytochrome oxidase assembly protein CcoS [Neorhodopirellula lusitana]|uniref:cbb3-type cytochrome oxidase assembly protein CcoS n=1 Tax=Neorhodopirellula lusitana TaxID=445327 RepID=UPI00384C0702